MAEKSEKKISRDRDVEDVPLEAKKLSALFADTYFVSVWPGHLRIVFGESLEDEAYYRTALG